MIEILYTNAQSICNKKNELELVVYDNEPDLVLITETWCHKDRLDITDAFLEIDGYEIVSELRQDRNDTVLGRGGGILVYKKIGLDVFINDDNSSFNQFCSFDIMNGNEKLTFYVIYHSPNSSKENTSELCQLLEKTKENNFNVLIGDFNLPDIDWNNSTAGPKGKSFLECADSKFLTQVVTMATHKHGNVLDLILTNRPDQIRSVDDIGRLGDSDHSILKVQIEANLRYSETNQKIPVWRKANVQAMKEDMDCINWTQEISSRSVNNGWEFFKAVVTETMEKNVPLKVRRNKNRPVWMNRTLLRLIRKKNRLHTNSKKSREPADHLKYLDARKQCKKAIQNAKRNYERMLSKEKNKRPFNAYVKGKTKSRVSVGPLLINDTLSSNNCEIANELNQYFSSVFTQEDISYVPESQDVSQGSALRMVEFRRLDIEKKIENLKTPSAPGPDGIPGEFLKSLKTSVSLPLSLIFTASLKESVVPSDWKMANVSPIYKSKGSKSQAGNYRPVSLTSISCKIMESIIRDAIIEHLDRSHMINPSQHGFMKKKSCTTNLIEFLENTTRAVDKRETMDLIYLDFSKAFDKVPRQRLISKLKAHGIVDCVLNWMNDWLTNRIQRVVLNGECSDWASVSSGVPQGSVLGPTAFIIFINDIDQEASLITSIMKFADDTKLGHVVRNEKDRDTLQSTLDSLHAWSDKWGMKFNGDKCKVMHIGQQNNCYTYYMNGEQLKTTDEEKDIGVVVHNSLKPTRQCAEASRTARGVLQQISRAFSYRDKVTFRNLYVSYVRPHLEFATAAWNPWYEQDISALENVQIKAVNMISGLKGKTYEEKLQEIGLHSLKHRRERFDMIETYKIISGRSNVNKHTYFEFAADQSTRNTRLAGDIYNIKPQRSELDVRKNFFTQRVTNSWNKLPSEIKHAASVKLFKNLYDNHVKSRPEG